MGGTFAHSARTGGSRAQSGVASCVRCRIGRGRGVGGRACPRGAGCAECDRDRPCARRTGAIHLPRQAVLLVPLRMGGRRLVLVRLWYLCRRRLGRHLWLERLDRAATLPRRAGRTAIPLLARALSTPPCRRIAWRWRVGTAATIVPEAACPRRRTARPETAPHNDAFAADADGLRAGSGPVPRPCDRDARSNGRAPEPPRRAARRTATTRSPTARRRSSPRPP